MGFPLGFRLLVIFSDEVTLLLGNVGSHNCILLGVFLHVFESAEFAVIDQLDPHQEVFFVEGDWVIDTLPQCDRHHGLSRRIGLIETAAIDFGEALSIIFYYKTLLAQRFPTSPHLSSRHCGLSGDQVECEREEVERTAQGSRIERKPDRLLGAPLTSRALLLALFPVLASLLLRFFLLLLSLIFLFLTDLQFQILWSVLSRSDPFLSNGNDSVGVLHRHL